MSDSPSLAGRALLALGLMIGFYLLALAIAGALLYAPYAEWVYLGKAQSRLVLLCLVGASAILWSIVPRIDRFVVRGSRLAKEEQPRLFAEIEGLAAATGQEMPAEVYLVGDVNAWVAQRGGWMGIGGRRVMGLGLPLLRTLTRAQMRAVLAHEFGHFHAGDTRLGPLIYRTRGAIERTIANLGSRGGGVHLLQAPFRWYGKMFLRVTHAVSRAQELSADALAARTVGARPLIEGLRATHGAAKAFDSYWRTECNPVLGAGFLPPLAEGFADFMRAEGVAAALRKAVDEELAQAKASPYDTHPPLPERVAALESLPQGEAAADDPLAITLLEDVPALEAAWLAAVASREQVSKLQPIPWSEVGTRVFVPYWKKLVQVNAAVLRGLTWDELPGRATDLAGFARHMVGTQNERSPANDESFQARQVCAALTGLALLERGAAIEALPGLPVTVRRGGEAFEPEPFARRLTEGQVTPEEWRGFCARHVLEKLELVGERT